MSINTSVPETAVSTPNGDQSRSVDVAKALVVETEVQNDSGNGMSEKAEESKADAQTSTRPDSRSTEDLSSTGCRDEKTAGEAVVSETETSGDEEEAQPEDESKYLSGLPLVFLTFGLCLSTFVIALDNTIIATAIPKITQIFDSLNDVGWYGSAYLLTTTSLQPTMGKIYTFFNVKVTFLLALFVFEVGSVICAAAQSSVMLIVGRAIAGAGASGLFSGGMTMLAYSVPLRKRALYLGLVSSMFGIASVVGPILGGAFTDRVSWRWCFWINLPFGGLAFATVFFFFKNPDREHSKKTFKQKVGEMDLLGALFLICAVVCLLLALQWGGTTYAWSDSKVWGNLLGFGLIGIVFIAIQFWRGEHSTIPLRIMKNRTIWAGCSFIAFVSMALYALIFYLPFYFQAVQGTTAEESGIRTIPLLVSVTVGSIFTGSLVTVFGWYMPFVWSGSVLFVIGTGLIYTLRVDSSTGTWIGYQILTGLGVGICVQVPFFSSQVVLDAKDMPTGNALTIFFNTLGGALSVSIAQNIFSNTLLQGLEAIPTLTLKQVADIIQAGATGVRAVTPPDALSDVLQAYDTAVTRSFILSIAAGGIAFIFSLFMEWKTVKGKNIGMGGGA